jgi:tRNA A58 N-methylase Trm61
MTSSIANLDKVDRFTIDLLEPTNRVESVLAELKRVALILNYPLLIRPYSESVNKAVKIINTPDELLGYLDEQ